MIPKVVHFVWIGEWKKSYEYGIQSVIQNTTMKPILHTNEEISIDCSGVEIRKIKNMYDDVVFSCIAHKTDVIRLDILYEYGGVYSDLDVIWLRNPTEHFKKKVVIGYTNKSFKILCNAVMMSEKGHEALLKYKEWLLSIMPCKKYWIPANPYKVWKDIVFMADKKDFFPIKYNDISKGFTFDDVKTSIAVHLFCSMHDMQTVYEKTFKDVLSL